MKWSIAMAERLHPPSNARMKASLCALIALAAVTMDAVHAQPERSSWNDFSGRAGETARLAALGKTWGAAKFFHPRLVNSHVDWDAALLAAISRADTANDGEEYVGDLNLMLSQLGDPLTKVSITARPKPAATGYNDDPLELRNGIVTIHLMALSAATSAEPLAVASQMATANGVIFDVRAQPNADPSALDAAELLFSRIIRASSNRTVQLGGQRFRSYVGYPPQRGTTTGGYYASLSTQLSPALEGDGRRAPPAIVLLTNGFSPGMALVAGLRAAGIARVVQEGDTPAATVTSAEVARGLTLTLQVAELVDPRDGMRFQPDAIARPGRGEEAARQLIALPVTLPPRQPAGTTPDGLYADRDAPYSEMAFPDRGHRLLALFRYWNVIEYFYPYKQLLGSSWDDVLLRYIPVFAECRNELEYEMAIRRLSAELHDTHGFVGPTKAFAQYTGMYTLPIGLRQIDGEAVVSAVLDKALPIHVGDAILEIDGMAMQSRQAWLAQYYSSSSPQASSALTGVIALRGRQGSTASLTIRTLSGETRKIEMDRSESISSPRLINARLRKTAPLSLLAGNIAYADLERVRLDQIDELFRLLHGASAAIFDLRGYPKGTGWLIASRLGKKSSAVAALFSAPNPDGDSFGATDMNMSHVVQRVAKGAGDRYAGRVLVLIDENTASQGEHTCLLFEAATHVVFVGSTTAGVDGDVTTMVLPGGISASFSGAAVTHADGRPLQRVGIAPTISAHPTTSGLAQGRDEVLDAAMQYLAGAH